MPTTSDVWMDSGAFSAWTLGTVLSLKRYCLWLQKHKPYINHYAVMDVIGDPKGTWANQERMEKEFGLTPVPCFHYGEDEVWLKQYLEKYRYIALGAMVPVSTEQLRPWLDRLFDVYFTGPTGLPRVHIHGFGMTTFDLMARYPWWSVDSSSWLMGGRAGTAMFLFGGRVHTLGCSEKSYGPGTVRGLPSAERLVVFAQAGAAGFTAEQLEESYVARNLMTLHTFEKWRAAQSMPVCIRPFGLFTEPKAILPTAAREMKWGSLKIYYAGQFPGTLLDWERLPDVPRMFTYNDLRDDGITRGSQQLEFRNVIEARRVHGRYGAGSFLE